MTTEVVLLLGLYAFILLGAFLGPRGPIGTFQDSAPKLGAKIERNISTGHGFIRNGSKVPDWQNDGSGGN